MTAKRSVDEYLGREYVPLEYNCFHFAAEIWMDLMGQDLIRLYGDAIKVGLDSRRLSRRLIEGFVELSKPADPCIVLFQNRRQSPHIGVYLRGRVLHINQHNGVRFEPIHAAQFGFTKTRYALPC